MTNQEIGKGSWGSVFTIHGSQHDVVKVYEKDDESATEMRAEKIALLSIAKHPSIVTIYGYGPDYIVLADCGKTTLFNCVKPEELDRIKEIVRRVLQGVRHMHAQGWVHLDLKCDNIMLKRPNFPVIIDFGKARRVRNGDIDDDGTVLVGGAFSYQPLEVLHRQYNYLHESTMPDDPICGTADVYSAGCILYNLLIGGVLPNGYFASNANTIAECIETMREQEWAGQEPFKALPVEQRKVLGGMLSIRDRLSANDVLRSPFFNIANVGEKKYSSPI